MLALTDRGPQELPRSITERIQEGKNLKAHYGRLSASDIWRFGIRNTYALCWEGSDVLHKLDVQLSVEALYPNAASDIIEGHYRRVGNERHYVWRKFTVVKDTFVWRVDLNSLPLPHPQTHAWKLQVNLKGKVVTLEEVLDYLKSHSYYRF